jgi:phospholipase C
MAWIKNRAFAFWRTTLLPLWAFIWYLWNRVRERRPWSDPSTDPIKHVFVLMLENHSFDQILGCFKDSGNYSKLDGIDSDTPRFNKDKEGNKYYQRASTDDNAPFDPNHEYPAVAEQLKDNHSGFVRNFQDTHKTAKPDDLQAVMNYFPKGALPAIHWLAETFTICDHWFSSVPGPTWTNRLFLLSGTSMGRVEMGSSENIAGLIGYNQTTIFNLLEEAAVPWRIYFHDFPQSWLLERQREPEMIGNYCPIGDEGDEASFENHLKLEGKNFPSFCFIEPRYYEPEQNDDHPTSSSMAAQQLIARVYNAIRAQEEVWNSSLLIVLYDEHGGFFDHAPIPDAVAPKIPEGYPHKDHGAKCDFKSLGVRVPALVVSPWVGQTLCAEELDHTSVLKYVCQKWKLPQLTARVDKSTDFGSVILKSRRNVPATPIRIPRERMKARAFAPATEDESDHQRALRALCDKIERDELAPIEIPEATRERLKARAMPGDTAQEMHLRSLAIAAAIKARKGK